VGGNLASYSVGPVIDSRTESPGVLSWVFCGFCGFTKIPSTSLHLIIYSCVHTDAIYANIYSCKRVVKEKSSGRFGLYFRALLKFKKKVKLKFYKANPTDNTVYDNVIVAMCAGKLK
jgi:hypothetical protein